jgi:hypothetical protein
MPKNEKTSKRVGSLASKVLRDTKSSRISRSIAASTLTQLPALRPFCDVFDLHASFTTGITVPRYVSRYQKLVERTPGRRTSLN